MFSFFIFSDAKAIAIGKNQIEVVKITLKMYVFTCFFVIIRLN